ncbi:hypothetical protein [Spongiimicrobium sp. 2-473A-2-J]|uniref:hypothetical protein n=1 Tax=Eudoraea algarum TaxID=3417568 RepID=UPI003D36CAC2
MAIYYPSLFCSKGSILQASKMIEFENFVIDRGEECYVFDIVGYGFDIYPLRDKSKIFRIMNSQMPDYFQIHATPENNKLDKVFSPYKARFKKDFLMDGVVAIKKGESFYFELDRVEKDYYDLFNDYRKVIRLKDSEAKFFLEFFEDEKD